MQAASERDVRQAPCSPPAAPLSTWSNSLYRTFPLGTDDVWVIDSIPVECARSREAVRRSDLAGWTEYGYCASHSRYF